MRKISWLEQKKQFLSDYFSKKNNGNVNIPLEEFNPSEENNTINKYRSWINLIDESKDLHPAFIMSSLDVHSSGFRTDNDKAQLILDSAFEKKTDEIFDMLEEKDLDISVVRERLLYYIIINRLYKKRLEDIVKKLKNLDPFELQN